MAEQRAAGRRWYAFEPKDSAAGRRLMAAGPEEQRDFVLAAMKRLDHRGRIKSLLDYEAWAIRKTMQALLRRRLPFAHDDVVSLLEWSTGSRTLRVRYAADDQGPPGLPEGARAYTCAPGRAGRLAENLESGYTTAETRRWATRLKELGGLSGTTLPLVRGEAWSDAAIEDIEGDTRRGRAWVGLLNLCAKASGAKPTAKWSRRPVPAREDVGRPTFEEAVSRWFPLR